MYTHELNMSERTQIGLLPSSSSSSMWPDVLIRCSAIRSPSSANQKLNSRWKPKSEQTTNFLARSCMLVCVCVFRTTLNGCLHIQRNMVVVRRITIYLPENCYSVKFKVSPSPFHFYMYIYI